MRWRVLLLVIALTCTFQCEVTADADDVLCVLLLSGLKKDDLDVNLLEKLQRHNVNINNIKNRKTIEKCIQRTNSDKPIENGHTEETMATKSKQPEQTFSQIKYNANESMRIKDKSSKDNESTENFKEPQAYANLTPSYENFIKLWEILNKTSLRDHETKTTTTTEKSLTIKLPLSFEKEKKTDHHATSVDLVHKILEDYISATKTTTKKPTIANHQLQNPIDIVSQEIMKLLHNNNHSKSLSGRESEKDQVDMISTPKSNYKVNEDPETSKKTTDKTIFNTTGTENNRKDTLRNPKINGFTDFDVWIKLDKTNYQDNNNKAGQNNENAQIAFDKQSKAYSQVQNIDFIRKMFESYSLLQKVTTIGPATTKEETDIVSQQMKKFLKKYMPYETDLENQKPKIIDKKYNIYELHHEKSPIYKSSNVALRDSSIEKVFSQNSQSNIPTISLHSSEDIKHFENNKRIIKTRSNVSKRNPTILNINGNNDPQSKYIEMFKAYIAANTQQPTTTPKHTELILQETVEYLGHNGRKNKRITDNDESYFLGNSDTNAYKSHFNYDHDFHKHKKESIVSNNELHYQDQSIIPKPTEVKFKPNLLLNQENDGIRLPHTSNISTNEIEKSCNSKELNHLFHMFENYIAKKKTDATKSTETIAKNVDNIDQKKFLDNINQYRRNKATQAPYQDKSPQMYINVKPLNTRKIDYMKEIQRQTNQLNMTSSEIFSRDMPHSNYSEKARENFIQEIKFNNTVPTKTKSLTEDVIKEITENVKKSVLKDLQKQMSTKLFSLRKDATTIAETTTTTPTTLDTTTASIITSTTISTSPITTSSSVIVDNVNISSVYYKKVAPPFEKESGMETRIDSASASPLINQNDLKTATSALENFIKLFEQFKQLKDTLPLPSDLKHISQKGRTKNEFHGPINVVYPTLLPLNYAYTGTTYNGSDTQVNPIYTNPYGLHISNPMIQKTAIGRGELKNSEYSVDPYNNLENAMEHAINAAVIQTDDIQVPLLGIPVPKSVRPINQNIIVTTKHPTIQHIEDNFKTNVLNNVKPKYHDYTIRGHGKYDTDWDRVRESDKDFDRQFNADMARHFNAEVTRYNSDRERSHGRDYGYGKYNPYDYKNILDRNRQSTRSRQAHSGDDNFYQAFLNDVKPKRNVMKPWEFSGSPRERKIDRYHEKLERPYGWHYNHSSRDTPKEKRLMVASRQQQPLNGLKKKTYEDDEHYIRVLKSQKKVNDILEKMLNPPDRIRSVEAI